MGNFFPLLFFSFLSRRQPDFPNAVAQQGISTGQPPNDPNAEGSSGAVLGGEEHRRRVEQRGEPKKEAEPITMTEETQYTPKTVKDVDAHEFVRQYAKHLKGKVSDRTIHDERVWHGERVHGEGEGWVTSRGGGGVDRRVPIPLRPRPRPQPSRIRAPMPGPETSGTKGTFV